MKIKFTHKIALLVFFVLLPVSANGYMLKWAHFNPPVIMQTAAGTADLLCYAEGTFTAIKFKPSWSTNELQLENRGNGVYGITLNISALVAGLASDDVKRKFVGYLRLYDNATLVDGQFNIFVDILTQDMPDAIPIVLGNNVQASSHLFNMIGTYDTPFDLVTKEFYSYYNDDYDFIAIISDEGRFLNRDYFSIKNDVQNIGAPIHDNSDYYGSSGRLQGIIRFPIPSFFDLAEPGAVHEIGHRWINFLNITPFNLGIPHWPLSTLAKDIMGFSLAGGEGGNFNFNVTPYGQNQWQLVPDNNPKVFSDLSLYLMGLIPSSEVSNHIIFLDQSQPISSGAVWSGPVANINGADIVGQLGERVPNYMTSQKEFRIATILLTKDKIASAETMRFYDWVASRAELTSITPVHEGLLKTTSNPFYLATGGRATLASTLTPSKIMPLPETGQVYSYQFVDAPVLDPDPSKAKPFAVGDLEGGTLSLRVGLLPFSGPVDIYIGLYVPQVSQEVWLMGPDLGLQPVSQGLVQWKEGITGSIDKVLYGEIPLQTLPPGAYILYTVVTPTRRLDAYYIWSTAFEIR